MTPKQLQILISAGVFSVALMKGAAYAEEIAPKTSTYTVQTGTTTAKETEAPPVKSKKTTSKKSAQHACGGAGGCSADRE